MEKLNAGAKKLGLDLNPRQVEQFSIYYQELIDWNQRINLTAITDYEEVQIKHFLDSLTVTLALKQNSESFRLIDVGTGAGLPGIPLKILLPEIKLVLLDATAKKAAFLAVASSSTSLTSGSKILSGTPGKPAPVPTSIRWKLSLSTGCFKA